MRLLFLLGLVFSAAAFVFAQQQDHDGAPRLRANPAEHGRYRYEARFTETPPRIDGDLSDPAWAAAPVVRQFTQQEPDTGTPATETTEFQVLYGATALYLGIYSRDSDPAGIVRNLLRFRDDSVWEKDDVVRIVLDTFHDHRRGYVFSINALGTKQDSQIDNQVWNSDWDEVWEVRTRLQDDGWSAEIYIPFRILRFPRGGGGVWGFNVYRSVKRRDEVSYWTPLPAGFSINRNEFHGHLEGITGIEPQRNLQVIPYGLFGLSNRAAQEADTTLDAGADLKYSLTSSLSLDLTYNTDFSQVEADDEQVNLTRFSLFFPEKRGFFLENAQSFSFGLEQEAQIFFSRRIGLAGREQVPILGGARLSGRLGGFDLGLLTTQTEDSAQAPGTNLSAARARWNLGGRSYIGGIFTSVASGEEGNRVFGPDARIWLGQSLRWEGFLAAMDDRKLSDHPMTYSTALIYEEDLWGFDFRTLSIDEEFSPGLGFIRRAGSRQHTGRLEKGFRLNRPWTRKLTLGAEISYITDPDGTLETREVEFAAFNRTDAGDFFRFEWQRTLENLRPGDDPFVINLRDGIIIPPGSYGFNRWEMEYQGFQGRSWVPGVELERGDFFGGRSTSLTFSSAWRASPHFLLDAEYEFNDIAIPEGAFSTNLWRGRFSVPFTARATADGFLQWNSLAEELSTQLRFHLIYARDSDLFVVFTDQRRERGGGRTERDQALQVKMTYRLYW